MNNKQMLKLDKAIDKWISESVLDSLKDFSVLQDERFANCFYRMLIGNFIFHYRRRVCRMSLDTRKQIYCRLDRKIREFFSVCPLSTQQD